jgi:sugar lactone lactonase YvrE
MRIGADGLTLYADLSAQASFHCNDMVADRHGRVYVGNFGFDLHGGAPVGDAEIVRVDPDGSLGVFCDQVVFPNGSVITPDERTLLVAETFAHRISAFAFDADGGMQSRSVWAELGEATPDGVCLDAEGALWVASPGTGELLRVQAGGSIVARCETRGTPYACMLGGDDRRTLYICTSETDNPETAARLKTGRIEQVRVPIPGAGLP